jgi:hypothetical protein
MAAPRAFPKSEGVKDATDQAKPPIQAKEAKSVFLVSNLKKRCNTSAIHP